VIKYRESTISAHHNYLVNGMLTQGFVVGNPNSPEGFFLVADIVPPGETGPQVSARLVDEKSHVLLELAPTRIVKNPGQCGRQVIADGFRIESSSGETLLEVRTRAFTNGYVTLIQARLFDEHGNLRVEPHGESIQVHGEALLSLEIPFVFSRG
jgi:hypothetical protein